MEKYLGLVLLMVMQFLFLWGSERLVFFHKALQHEDESMALHLLRSGFSAHMCTPSGETLLMSAAWSNQKMVVQELIEAGANLDIQTNYGTTALMGAAQNGHKDIVQFLIDKGVDINMRTSAGYNALLYAVQKGYVEIALLLMKAGSDINISSVQGHMPILCALADKNKNMLIHLLQCGADIAPSQDGEKNKGCKLPLEYVHYMTERATCITYHLESVYDMPRDITRLIWCMADAPASRIPPTTHNYSS